MALSTLSQRLNGAPRAARRQAAVSRSRGKLAVMCKAHKVTVLPGDGIGPEITKVAIEVLEKAGKAEGETFEFKYALIGGAAIDATGSPLPAETLDQCKASDAVLLAAIGG
jgi:3-isopropylmalate dehydrogenase